ncbi:MAG: hypothetical protein J6C77_03550 [Muribaculaceae bacterium]|nr:hypothetical protein [Muribaculaceae bacterium]
MSGTLQQRLQAVTGKMHLLVSRYENLLKAKSDADARIAALEGELAAERKLNERLKVEAEELRVVTTLSPKGDDVARSRAYLAELVRDIDKCIDELTQ